jgi:hypothetical protein
MTDTLPQHVIDALNARILPSVTAWIRAERIDPLRDIDLVSVQAHENGRDWVLKVHMEDGMQVFPILFPVLN